ncbi:B4galnt3p [Desmophyllum pertusum]|uniref:B4galnt3p n=1 Tax=Desmophyllum pertusum TaxID=174260 RepID=A0A9W9YX99_9CNID|nr:B4galnt3p [Desmophyllum pertusum]
MASIGSFIRSRKFQRVGKVFIVILLSFVICYYIFNVSTQSPSDKIHDNNDTLWVAANTVIDKWPASKPAVGALNVHIWRGLCGSNIPNLRQSLFFPHYPDESSKKFITEFQIEDNSVDYGQQIFGFVHTPDSSGSYRFAIASDDESELWLSPSEDPNEKQLIARVFIKVLMRGRKGMN